MRLLATLLFGMLAINPLIGQPARIDIFNDQRTLISNALTGLRVQYSDGIHVQFYFAPGVTTNEAVFTAPFPSTKVAPTVSVLSLGRYNANPPGGVSSVLTGYTGGEVISYQMRAFETNYGSSYEAAFDAPSLNGRRALVGKSAIAQLIMPFPIEIAPRTTNCGGFFVDIASGGAYLAVNDIVVAEGSNGLATARFVISLLNVQTQSVSVNFATSNGTALAGSDYIATNGTVTFAPGETEMPVEVTLTSDTEPEPDELFYLDLGNAVNGILTRPRATGTITETRIVSTSVDAAVSFNTVSNRHYMLQRSTNFIFWEPVAGATNVPGTGGNVTVVDRGNGRLSPVIYRATVLEE